MQFRTIGKARHDPLFVSLLSHVSHSLGSSPCESLVILVKSVFSGRIDAPIPSTLSPQNTVCAYLFVCSNSGTDLALQTERFPFRHLPSKFVISQPQPATSPALFWFSGAFVMPIPIARLEDELLAMSADEAPGREFCHAVAELARTGRFTQLRGILPEVVYNELWQRYRVAPAAFVDDWQNLARQMRQGFIEHARSRLTSLTRMQISQETGTPPPWQEIQLALDSQQNDLLRAAFGIELLRMIEPAVRRATHLRECVVAAQSSEEADRYLSEATRCYFFGLYTACAVMCRSVLEEAIKQQLPHALLKLVRTRYRNAATLGNLLHEVNNNLQQTGFDPDFPRVANSVNDTGKRAVHQGLLSEEEARQCLQSARHALQLLLRP